MADKLVILNGYFELDGTPYSDEIESSDLNSDLNNPNSTTFGDAGVSTFEPGLETNQCSVGAVFNKDMSTGLHPYLRANKGTKVTAKVRASNAAESASNPTASFSVIVPAIGLTASGVGEVHKKSLTFTVSGALTWTP